MMVKYIYINAHMDSAVVVSQCGVVGCNSTHVMSCYNDRLESLNSSTLVLLQLISVVIYRIDLKGRAFSIGSIARQAQ